jgi:hypothetical protein
VSPASSGASTSTLLRSNAYPVGRRDHRETGGAGASRVFLFLFVDRGWSVKWILKLVAMGGKATCVNIMEISKPDDLGDVANLGDRDAREG